MAGRAKIINRETVTYFAVGVLTTLLDYVIFIIVNEALKHSGIDYALSVSIATALSWLGAVIFAYVANKLIVFRNFSLGFNHLIREFGGFFGARVLSGIITLVLMYLLTSKLFINEYIAKVFTSVFNLVFNYVASKFFIFKK